MTKKSVDSVIQNGMNIFDWFFLDGRFISELKQRFQSRMITKFLKFSDKILFRKTRRSPPKKKLEVFYAELDEHGHPGKWTKELLSESAFRISGKRFSRKTKKETIVRYIRGLLALIMISGTVYAIHYFAKRKAERKELEFMFS